MGLITLLKSVVGRFGLSFYPTFILKTNIMEIWKQFQNTNYLVSSLGNVKSFDATLEHKRKSGLVVKRRYKGRNLNPGNSNGYLYVRLNKKGFRINRLVAMVFLPNPKSYPFVNHINGIKTDNRVENLEWCTRQENMDHACAIGLLNSKGSNNPKAKLNEEIVYHIKYKEDRNRDNVIILSKKYNVLYGTIYSIWSNGTWKHV